VFIVSVLRKATIAAASALSVGLFLACSCAAPAAGSGSPTAAAPLSAAAATGASDADDPSTFGAVRTSTISLSENGQESIVSTQAETVGAFLAERSIVLAPDDYLSVPADSLLVDGMRVEHRSALDVVIHIGAATRTARTTAATVADLLAEQHLTVGPNDTVSPSLSARPDAHVAVSVTHAAHRHIHVARRPAIAPVAVAPAAPAPEAPTAPTAPAPAPLEPAVAPLVAAHEFLAARVVHAPQSKVLARGIATYVSLAHVAQQGFENALHFAGRALHMIATAYTAGCFGCSGVTAIGKHAGFGIIAVDPHVIPLGTKLFIPGYGQAIAGDTGGAIHGSRVDLGMNTYGAAMRWGSRSVTVYLLR
jgi:3D (Asp-Asp-Asp) domain-containing protein